MAATRGEIAILFLLAVSLAGGALLCGVAWQRRVAANRRAEISIGPIARLTPHDLPRKGVPLIDPERRPALVLDINRATPEQLDGLPGVGKVLAERIIEFRGQRGQIEALEELGAVEGISPKKLAQLAPFLTTVATLATAVPIEQALDLNLATAEQLEALPGIGPTLAAAIIETRRSKGSFRSLDDLQDVPGLGEATFRKFAERVTVK